MADTFTYAVTTNSIAVTVALETFWTAFPAWDGETGVILEIAVARLDGEGNYWDPEEATENQSLEFAWADLTSPHTETVTGLDNTYSYAVTVTQRAGFQYLVETATTALTPDPEEPPVDPPDPPTPPPPPPPPPPDPDPVDPAAPTDPGHGGDDVPLNTGTAAIQRVFDPDRPSAAWTYQMPPVVSPGRLIRPTRLIARFTGTVTLTAAATTGATETAVKTDRALTTSGMERFAPTATGERLDFTFEGASESVLKSVALDVATRRA